MAFRTGFRSVFTGVGGPCLIEEGLLTLPEMLREYGYTTALFGKWHLGMTFHGAEGNPITTVPLSPCVASTTRARCPTASCIAGSTGFFRHGLLSDHRFPSRLYGRRPHPGSTDRDVGQNEKPKARLLKGGQMRRANNFQVKFPKKWLRAS